jgi:methyl-accepting chemotaxis protein
VRWKDRLELRILLLVILLPLCGVVGVSLGVTHLLRTGFHEVARRQSASTAELITRTVERTMLEGRADITRSVVRDLRGLSGVEGVDVLNGAGREAFQKDAPESEGAALAKLRGGASELVENDLETLVFYRPLRNAPECRQCHGADAPILGATKVTLSLRETFSGLTAKIAVAVALSLVGVALMGALLWWTIRRYVFLPVRRIRDAAAALAGGDLTVDLALEGRDEVGTLWAGLRAAVRAIGAIIRRLHAVARRVEEIAQRTELESAEVVHAASVEATSFDHIAASMEELNASIGELSGEIETLSTAADTVHAASRETAASTAEVLRRSTDLSGSVGEVSGTVGEMSHTIRELSWGTTHLSEVSTQTLGAVQGIERTIAAVEAQARDAASLSAQVRREAEELGLPSVRRTLEGMERIRESVRQASTFVGSLGERSQQIGAILTVIDEVNDRTSLLALNAAILAAQAGENGAGFQVVAVEIRKLAVRTARSTVEIAELIRNVQAEVSGAVEAMRDGLGKVEAGFGCAQESGSALEKIVASSRSSTAMAESIRESAGEQTAGLATVREAMGRLEQMAQFLAAGTAEQKREVDSIHGRLEQIVEAADRIRASNEEQTQAGAHVARAAAQVSEGTARMSLALREEKEGCAQIMQALVRVVDLPRQNRSLALRINQGLRRIHGDTQLLTAEVGRFRVPAEEAAAGLRFGVVPLENPAEMHRRFTPLAEYLGRALGSAVELRVALDFDEAVRDLGEGRTRFAYLTPSTFVQARAQHAGVRLVAVALRNGRPFQHAAIVVRRGTGPRALAELRGKTFAFGDPSSTSSHIVPRAMLLDAGIALETLAGFEYLGHHDAVARAVLNGEYDAGAVMASVASRYAAEGLETLAESAPIPEFNVCAAPEVGAEEFAACRAALLALGRETEAGRGVLAAISAEYTGFTAGDEREYDAVRRMMQRLNLMQEGS